MDAKPLFVVLIFILFLSLFAGGIMSSTDLSPGDGDHSPSGGGAASGGVDYGVFSGSGNTAVGGVSANAGGVAGGPCGNVYTVRSGDTLSRIAQNCGLPLNVLLSINPSISNPNLIRAGQQINIYVASAAKPAATHTPVPQPTKTPGDQLRPGGLVPVEVKGFPPDTEVIVSIGKEGAKGTAVEDGKTDQNGHLKINVKIPTKAKAGEKWVVTIATTGRNPITVKSPVFTLHK